MAAYQVGVYVQHSVTIAVPVFAHAGIKQAYTHTPTLTCTNMDKHIFASPDVTVGVMQVGRAYLPVL